MLNKTLSWNRIIRPIFFRLPAEQAHHAAMSLFSKASALPGVGGQLRRRYRVEDPRLQISLFGLQFPNPVGLAAGFDKAGTWYNQLANLGFGCIEIGTITGQAQPGNPKPRLFRLPTDKAIVNRMGFNSDGCEHAAAQLQTQRNSPCVLGINIGKSKVVELPEAPAEYQKSFEKLFRFADYFTINVSSPNTPGLRELQNREHLVDIIQAVQHTNFQLSRQTRKSEKPVLLKIAPDLSEGQLEEIASVAIEYRLSGIIATNTTISRDRLKTGKTTIDRIGAGGLSGQPLKMRSRAVVSQLYKLLPKEIPIIGVGGIGDGEDAWQMIRAGASLVQIYTGFVYGGPGLIRDINRYLLTELQANGLDHISEAIGMAHKTTL